MRTRKRRIQRLREARVGVVDIVRSFRVMHLQAQASESASSTRSKPRRCALPCWNQRRPVPLDTDRQAQQRSSRHDETTATTGNLVPGTRPARGFGVHLTGGSPKDCDSEISLPEVVREDYCEATTPCGAEEDTSMGTLVSVVESQGSSRGGSPAVHSLSPSKYTPDFDAVGIDKN